MKGLNRTLIIGSVLLIAGVVWGLTMNGIGMIEWILLLLGMMLGIVAGMIQGWVLLLNKRGQIGSGKRTFWIVGTLIVLVALKVTINIAFPTYIATSGSGIWLSVVFAVGGLLLGRSYFHSSSSVERKRKIS
ncbi:hypothetical protein CJP46_17170 [Paenibacillus sp. XY044]|nr:hypothetical protein CJP46_17170 [Paenibacillus sp. XY044]